MTTRICGYTDQYLIMRRIFGSGQPKAPPPNLNDAIVNLDSRSETVEKKIAKLDADLVKLRDQMKKMRDGPAKNLIKQKALRILKQKKTFETQKEQLDTQTFNMEQSNFALQGMKDNQVTVAAMQAGLKSMRTEYKKIDINKIDTLQDEMEEMLEMNNEIQDTLSRQYDTPELDEADLEAELAALGDDLELDADTSYLDEAINAPAVPSREPGSKLVTEQGVAVDEFGLPKIPAS